jgi:hypothetical protein
LRSEYLLDPAARGGRPAINEAEIGGVAWRRDVAELRHEAVEQIRRRQL